MKLKVLPGARVLQCTDTKQLFVDTGAGSDLVPVSVPTIDLDALGIPSMYHVLVARYMGSTGGKIGDCEVRNGGLCLYCDTAPIYAAMSSGSVTLRLKYDQNSETASSSRANVTWLSDTDVYQAVGRSYVNGAFYNMILEAYYEYIWVTITIEASDNMDASVAATFANMEVT